MTYEKIGNTIRQLRMARGLSQRALARELKTNANTISRWEAGQYRPAVADLERLAQLFTVPITSFFEDVEPDSRTHTLLAATRDLNDADLKEVIRYALYRRATASIELAGCK